MKKSAALIAALVIMLPHSVRAQVESNFYAGGGVRIGYSTSTCNAGILGAIRYNSNSGGRIDFCNGTAWANVGSSGGSIDALTDGKADYTSDHNFMIGTPSDAWAIASGGQHNLMIGELAGDSVTTGDRNIAIGYGALTGVTTTVENIAVGYNALLVNTSGDQNIAIGARALDSNVNGYTNVSIGTDTMQANVSGGDNVAVGHNALSVAATGVKNVALGANALRDSGGDGSIGIGYAAGVNSSANNLIAIGDNALSSSSGNNNIGIGFQAGNSITSGAGNIVLGYDVDAPTATTSNHLNIGNLITGTLNAGLMQVNGTGALTLPIGQTGNRPTGVNGMLRYNSQTSKFEGYQAGAWLDIITAGGTPAGANTQIQFNNSGAFGASANLTWNGTKLAVTGDIEYTGVSTDVSDRRLKTDIVPLSESGSLLERINNIDTYRFRMKDDKAGAVEFGVMAQELKDVFPELVVTDTSTPEGYMSVNYVGLIAPMIAAIQEQQAIIDKQQSQIERQQQQIDALLKALPATNPQ